MHTGPLSSSFMNDCTLLRSVPTLPQSPAALRPWQGFSLLIEAQRLYKPVSDHVLVLSTPTMSICG